MQPHDSTTHQTRCLVRGIGVAGYEAPSRLTCYPDSAARGRVRSSPWLPSPLLIPTSSQDANSSVINVLLHLSPSSLYQARLYSDYTAFQPTPSQNYADILTPYILLSTLENSSETTFTSSLWKESHGQIQSRCARKGSSSKSLIYSTEPAIIFSLPWTMDVNRMTVSSWHFPAHRHHHHLTHSHHLSPVLPPPIPSKV